MNNHSSYHNTKHDRYGDHGRSTGAAIAQGNAEARSSSGDARRIRKKGKGRDRERGFRVIH